MVRDLVLKGGLAACGFLHAGRKSRPRPISDPVPCRGMRCLTDFAGRIGDRLQRELEAAPLALVGHGEVLGRRFAVLSGLKLIGELLPFAKGAESGPLDSGNMDESVL